jgi:hypothetical protein
MAHFAELDINNRVIDIRVISNDFVNANGGDLSILAEQAVLADTPLSPNGVRYKQTSYHGNFRKNVENVISIGIHSELENTFNKELNKNIFDFNDVRGRQLKNFDSINFSNSVVLCENAIIFLGKKIKIGMTSSWK